MQTKGSTEQSVRPQNRYAYNNGSGGGGGRMLAMCSRVGPPTTQAAQPRPAALHLGWPCCTTPRLGSQAAQARKDAPGPPNP